MLATARRRRNNRRERENNGGKKETHDTRRRRKKRRRTQNVGETWTSHNLSVARATIRRHETALRERLREKRGAVPRFANSTRRAVSRARETDSGYRGRDEGKSEEREREREGRIPGREKQPKRGRGMENVEKTESTSKGRGGS